MPIEPFALISGAPYFAPEMVGLLEAQGLNHKLCRMLQPNTDSTFGERALQYPHHNRCCSRKQDNQRLSTVFQTCRGPGLRSTQPVPGHVSCSFQKQRLELSSLQCMTKCIQRRLHFDGACSQETRKVGSIPVRQLPFASEFRRCYLTSCAVVDIARLSHMQSG